MRIVIVMFFVLLIAVSLVLSGLIFQYNMSVYFGLNVPFWLDVLGGAFSSAINIPAAIVALILEYVGHTLPIFEG